MHGGVPNKESNEELRNILGKLASNSDLLDNSNYTQYIMLLLEAGANPNIQNQDGKTLLHYVAERNDINGIRYFLGVIKANPSIRDQSGKTPFEYVTEHNCLQAIKDLGYDLDDSHENKGNSTTLDSSVDDCSNNSDNGTQVKSVKLNNCNTEEENSSYSSNDYLFLEDSLLAKLEIPLTTDERELIGKFCEEIIGITAQNKQESEESILESIEKIVNEYLEKGLRLNSGCSNDNDNGDKETVTSLIFKEMEEVIAQLRVNPRSSTAMLNTHDYTDEGDGDEYKADEYKTSDIIIKRITSNLLLKGGMGKKFLSGDTELTNKHYDFDYLDDLKRQYKDRKEELISIACEGIRLLA